jgi:hypothetical protein
MRAIVVRKDIEIEMEEEFSTSMEPQLRRTWVTRTKKRKADETSN